MLNTITVFVLDSDAVERKWIVSALSPVVESVVVLDEPATVQAMPLEHPAACLIACTEPQESTVLELIREVRRSGSHLPAIVLGSHAAFRTAIEIARLDGTAFLERPLSVLQLRAAVRKVCEASP